VRKARRLSANARVGVVVVLSTVFAAEGTVSVHDGSQWFADRILETATPRFDFRVSAPSEIIDKVSARHESGKRCVVRVAVGCRNSIRSLTRLLRVPGA
jgi:hypothetical protein